MNSEFTIAVHSLVYLNHKGDTVSSEELARNVCTNPVRIRKVMAKCKSAGLVTTKEGSSGGYFFSCNPKQVTLCMIQEALGLQMVCAPWKSGNVEMNCLIASGMAGVMDDICIQLDEACKQKLSEISIDDIDKTIFHK